MGKVTKQLREIEMSPENIKILKKSYAVAVETKALDFECMGAEFDTRYAGYLIEFYENAFKGMKEPKKEKEQKEEKVKVVEEVKKTRKAKAVKTK